MTAGTITASDARRQGRKLLIEVEEFAIIRLTLATSPRRHHEQIDRRDLWRVIAQESPPTGSGAIYAGTIAGLREYQPRPAEERRHRN